MKNNTQVLTERNCKQKDETILLRFYVALEISSFFMSFNPYLLGAEK